MTEPNDGGTDVIDDDTSTTPTGDKTGAGEPASDDLEARLAELEADRDKWKAQARKHEGRARDNAQAASKSSTLEQQMEQLRQDIADRDVKDVERNQRLAMTQVKAQIAEAGVKTKDVADLLELVDPLRLLTDGEPDEKAIAKIAASIARTGGRPTPDRDQGRSGGTAPADMNTLIRRAAGRND